MSDIENDHDMTDAAMLDMLDTRMVALARKVDALAVVLARIEERMSVSSAAMTTQGTTLAQLTITRPLDQLEKVRAAVPSGIRGAWRLHASMSTVDRRCRWLRPRTLCHLQ